MTTVPKQRGDAPSNLSAPVYRRSSETVRPPNNADGKVQRSAYEDAAPKNK